MHHSTRPLACCAAETSSVGRSSRSTIKLFIIIMLLSSEVGGFIGKTKHGELSLFANAVC